MMKNLRLGLRSDGKKKYVALRMIPCFACRGGHSYFQFGRPSKITELEGTAILFTRLLSFYFVNVQSGTTPSSVYSTDS